MGDVAMAVPVLREFSKQYPAVKVTVVSRPFFAPFFEGIKNLDFFAVDLKDRHKAMPGLFRLYNDLRKRDIDAIADLHNVLRSRIVDALFWAWGKPLAIIDKARGEKKALTRAKSKLFLPLKPTVERYADVFRKLGFALELANPVFPPKAALNSKITAFTSAKEGKWIGIAPFAKHKGKVYPFDLMDEVISGLAQDQAARIFLFGSGQSEITTLGAFAHNHHNITVVAGNLSLSEELSLISNLDLMLSMDSGNAHIAAMFGIPTITLWGATHPYAGFAPFAQPAENALVPDREQYPLLPTSVYGNKEVKGYENAMRTILPGTVVRKVIATLNKNARY